MHRAANPTRSVLRRTVKPFAYKAIDTAFPRGLPRHIDGEPIRLAMQASRFYSSIYEPSKAAFLRQHCKRGATAIDVGANFGVFTVMMARAVSPSGHVVAFEPTPSTCAALRKTVFDNGCDRLVTVREEAVSSDDGVQRLYASQYQGDMGNSLIIHGSHVTESIPVFTVKLDSLFAEIPVSCIKIDAEGAELDILQGARSVLDEYRPAITVEVHPWALSHKRQHTAELWLLLRDRGYSVFRDGVELDETSFVEERGYFEAQAVHPDRA
jgi:FkbM family methyltransferase